MNNELFLKVVSAIITIIVSLITAFVIPWLKSKMTSDQLDQLQKYAEIGVRCAEQIFGTEEYQQKKTYVQNYLLNVINDKLSLTITQEDLNNLIESTVNSVKYGTEYTRK